MKCPKCNGKTHITNSRADKDKVSRSRKCYECNYLFYTTEQILPDSKREYYKTRNKIKLRKELNIEL